jgi:signal peptidase I
MEVASREEFEKIKKLPFFKGVIVSDSMEPLLKIGDKIVVEVGTRELKRFDLIVFWNGEKLVCHYVWAMNRLVTPFLLQTRSMKYLGKDVPINWDDYLGKVHSHRLFGLAKFKLMTRLWFKLKK